MSANRRAESTAVGPIEKVARGAECDPLMSAMAPIPTQISASQRNDAKCQFRTNAVQQFDAFCAPPHRAACHVCNESLARPIAQVASFHTAIIGSRTDSPVVGVTSGLTISQRGLGRKLRNLRGGLVEVISKRIGLGCAGRRQLSVRPVRR
jgi:hypothetical protein